MNLFRWQENCLQSWLDHDTHGIISVVTGAGKTVFALAAAEILINQYSGILNIRIIVPTTALLRQWKKDIFSFFPDLPREEVGIYYSEVRDDPNRTFMIYVVNSARYAVSRHIRDGMLQDRHQFLICDECHRYTGESNRLIFAFRTLPEFRENLYHSLGMSATPHTALYNEVLVPSLGKEIFRYGNHQARKDDSIASLSLLNVTVPLKTIELKQYEALDFRIRKAYAQLIKEYPDLKGKNIDSLFRYLSSFIEEDEDSLPSLYCRLIRQRREIVLLASMRIECAAEIMKLLHREERVIIFCDRISQAEKLYKRIRAEGIANIGHYHSDMTPQMRKINLDAFRSGEVRILITCKALDEGLNVPDASVGIVVSTSKNERQRIQRLGRILRKNKDKKAVMYYLHTSLSADSQIYLADLAEDTDIAELEYLSKESGFYCEEYVARAQVIMERNDFSREEYAEFMRCVNEGNGKADWLLSKSLYQKNIQNANDQKERNYWNIMRTIASADLI